jgi:hypothetical protein
MLQCDCLQHGMRPRPKSQGAYLVEAIRRGYELRYPPEEPEMFAGIWGMLSLPEQAGYHHAGIKLLGVAEDLFETNADPGAWSQELRGVVRFMVCQNIDPEEVAPDVHSEAPSGSGTSPS